MPGFLFASGRQASNRTGQPLRPLALAHTVRLWANIFAGDLITLVFFSMIPIGIPIIFSGLHIVVAVLQAYVFMLLPIIAPGAVLTSTELLF